MLCINAVDLARRKKCLSHGSIKMSMTSFSGKTRFLTTRKESKRTQVQ